MTESQILNGVKYIGQVWAHAVTLLSCIREAPFSKLERYTQYHKSFHNFPLVLKQMLR
jgi:hypothetical protein